MLVEHPILKLSPIVHYFWENFTLDFGVWLWELVVIQPEDH